ncbi:hypothetical protein CDL12_29327 [Handroanthus impetiginosus]|uniref:Activator of Hsp90 ATPase AHSA1-like N-terminal domain-containing protein n=1 Tax=Handroanthus impetiginosus TaxID=429701 RepID=A0A2G9FYP6_9LAMI|nr:hypothetical protein CDL12_29327 [Handroanthus impetiginosus]
MARIGEGDERWIVEDRPDGTNVHNWHWAETDCLDWSRNFLSDRLCDKTILSGEGNLYIKTKKIEKLEGEAYVNVRKGKIIPGYELNLVLSYEAEAKDSDGSSVILKTEGSVEVPYISDENAGEDPEIRISITDGGPIGQRLKEAFILKGKPFVFEKIREFVDAMAKAKGRPAKDDLEGKKAAVRKPSSGSNNANAAVSSGLSAVESKKTGEKRKEGFKTIKMSERFNCRAKDLYEILMDENRWKGFTQSNAWINKEATIIMQVRLTFEEPESGVTIVKLTHNDVPEEDRYGNATVVENRERGWQDLIFHRIRAVFGFGI